jgi:hypothetical protein
MTALPYPKLKLLDKLIVAMSCELFGSQKNAGEYLGISQARVSQFMKGDADEVRMEVAKALWNAGKKHNILGPGAVVPMTEKEMMELIEREPARIEALPEATVEMLDKSLMDRLVQEGRIIVSEIKRNEL